MAKNSDFFKLVDQRINELRGEFNNLVDNIKGIQAAFPVSKSSTVGQDGNVVFYLTDDNTATGKNIFPNGQPILDTLTLRANNEGNAPHTFSEPVLSNSNRTLTVSVKKASGISVQALGLTLLGAPVPALGSVIKAVLWGR